jgi:hypothetical protein
MNLTTSDTPEIFLWRPINPPEGWEERFGYYGVAKSGMVFLPAKSVNRSENELLLCASWDNEPVLWVETEIALFRTEWLKDNYPAKSRDIDSVVTRVREHAKTA